jgi:hypothetical protein
MSKKLFGTPSNVCFNHATGNDFHVHVVCIYLPMLPAGIPAAGYKHIAYFDGNRKAYDAFYDLQVEESARVLPAVPLLPSDRRGCGFKFSICQPVLE